MKGITNINEQNFLELRENARRLHRSILHNSKLLQSFKVMKSNDRAMIYDSAELFINDNEGDFEIEDIEEGRP